ncbi:MAG TPA: amidohydrolase family protein [Chitinophagaceae bacterium]|nr:amidohydrolase family protein [Chitinophagaceae bacterium]
MIVDSHVHFWKYDKKRDAWITNRMKILQQDYLPEHLITTLKRNGIDAVVAVQADQSELETHFLVEMSRTHDFIKGVVGWIDLQHENISERLEYFSQYSVIKGWRHIVQSEEDDFMYQDAFRNGITALQTYNYTYDILIYHPQLKAAVDLVIAFPEQEFIIDHCAKPGIREKKIEEWKIYIKEVAQNPNVNCKLSGLLTEAAWKNWTPAQFYPYLDVVFEAFGTDRLLYGSDWPVLLLSGAYVQWKSLLGKYMENFKEEDRLKIFGLNAIQFYNLQV